MMRRFIPSLTVALSMLVFSAQIYSAPPSQQKPAPRRANVALIDVNYVFKNHTRLKRTMEQMEQEVKTFQQEMTQTRQQLIKRNQQLSEFKPGSNEHTTLQREIAQKMADLKVRSDLKQKELFDRRANLYFETYKQIVDEVNRLAAHYQLDLIMRHDREPIDSSQTNDIVQAINRPVLFQRSLDVTDIVLKSLNRSDMARAPSNRGTRSQ